MRNCWQESETETETLLLLGRRMPVQPTHPPIIMYYQGCIWWRQEEEEEEEEKLVIWQSIKLIRRKGKERKGKERKGKERKGGAVMEWDGRRVFIQEEEEQNELANDCNNNVNWSRCVWWWWWWEGGGGGLVGSCGTCVTRSVWSAFNNGTIVLCFALLCFLVCLSIYSSAAVHNCVPTVRVANNNNNNNNNNNSPPD